MNTLPTNLIESALALTGKKMGDMNEISNIDVYRDVELQETKVIPTGYTFSYPKFYAYLLSPEFIEKYVPIQRSYKETVIEDFGTAIYEHQRRDEKFPEGNPADMISLLSKI